LASHRPQSESRFLARRGDLPEAEQKVVWATQAVPVPDLFMQKVDGVAEAPQLFENCCNRVSRAIRTIYIWTAFGNSAAKWSMKTRTDGNRPRLYGMSAVMMESPANQVGRTRCSAPDRMSSRQT
jgi:hypothetical protein